MRVERMAKPLRIPLGGNFATGAFHARYSPRYGRGPARPSRPRPCLEQSGHMAVAAVAWTHMTPAAQARAAALLKLNPDYAKRIADAAPGDEDRTAFLRAATWPDEIKHTPKAITMTAIPRPPPMPAT